MPVLDDAKEVVDVIKKAGNPEAIILFGSIARGVKGKDIDLLIIGNKREKKRLQGVSIRSFRSIHWIPFSSQKNAPGDVLSGKSVLTPYSEGREVALHAQFTEGLV